MYISSSNKALFRRNINELIKCCVDGGNVNKFVLVPIDCVVVFYVLGYTSLFGF